MLKNESLSVIIPSRNKEEWRLKEVIKRINSDLIREIILVDYKSEKPIKLDGINKCKIIRSECDTWNKAHAINIGFKNSTGEYIMTMDADILISPDFFNKVEKLISDNSFIYTNKVKRIDKENLTDKWRKNLGLSRSWGSVYNYDVMQEVHNTATGGFQIFPRRFFEKIRGLDENLIYYGGMDNITLIEAKREGLNVIILNDTILHLEHPNLKEDNLPEEERDFARYVRNDRANLMRQILDVCYNKNPVFFGKIDKPNNYVLEKYRKEYDRLYREYIEQEKNSFELPRETKIMIAVINNTKILPERFVQNLFNLFNYTSNLFPNTEIHYIKSAQNNNMRNMSIMKAIDLNFDYLVQLDTDHTYDKDFIIKMIGRNVDFITGCTRRRNKPYTPTQYYKFKIPLLTEDNFVYTNGKEGVIEIGASGPVGMLMKVSALKKLEYPYYYMDYDCEAIMSEDIKILNTEHNMPILNKVEDSFHPIIRKTPIGGDYVFCRQLNEKGFKIWLDTSIEFPHEVYGFVRGIGQKEDKVKQIMTID